MNHDERIGNEVMSMTVAEMAELPAVELVGLVLNLRFKLRNASDLLNDCGYALQDGKWVDTENMEEDE